MKTTDKNEKREKMKDWEKKWDKEFKDYFSSEYLVCGKCGHSKENHWWNGGGWIRASGYDACHVEGCKCGYPENEKIVVTYDEKNIKRFKDFIRQLLKDFGEKVIGENEAEITIGDTEYDGRTRNSLRAEQRARLEHLTQDFTITKPELTIKNLLSKKEEK